MTKRILLVITLLLGIQLTAQATSYSLPPNGDDMVGEAFIISAHSGDTLLKIASDYNIGIHEIAEANPGINPRAIRPGQKIIIPTAYLLPKWREGVVINIPELRLYYFPKGSNTVYTYPVGLGRRDWRTPIAKTKVVRKKHLPSWHAPESIKDFVFEQTGRMLPDVIPPGPDNPLGKHAIYLSLSGYLIHGTNQPWSVGQLISSGCIRMYNQDVAELFEHIQIGAPVRIIHHPYKVGWHRNQLFVEAHEALANQGEPSKLNVVSIDKALRLNLDSYHDASINWQQVDRAVRERRGIPLAVGGKQQVATAPTGY